MPICDSLHQNLNKFRLDGSFCDVTIRVDDEKTFQCHRVVLASGCDYFKCLFGGNFKESCSPVNNINLPDVDAVSFEIILEFIYLGREPYCDENNIYGLLRSSDFLQLQAVKNFCVEYVLKHAASFSSVCKLEVFQLACCMKDHLLIDTLSKYYVVFLKDFVRKDFFLEMAYDCLNLVLQRYRISTVKFNNENFLLDAIVRWLFFSFEKRQKFFQNLIEMINFGKITEDCIKFLLQEYKTECTMNPESDERNAATLKTLVSGAFSYKRIVDDDDSMMPVSYQDPPLVITPAIYIYARLAHKKLYGHTYKFCSVVWSPNDSSRANDSSNRFDPPTANNCAVKPFWALSCTFPMDAYNFVLASSDKYNHIYCLFNGSTFRAYDSVDLSSNRYTALSAPTGYFDASIVNIETCGSDDGNIYFWKKSDSQIYCYNCDADRWFPIIGLKTHVKEFSCVAHNNLLYAIAGKNSNGEVLDEYIQAYDYRTPRWLQISKSKTKSSSYFASTYSSSCDNYRLASCVADGKIYVYNGKQFRVFEPRAGKWRDISDYRRGIGCTGTSWESDYDKLKLIPYRDELFVFGSGSQNYLTYNFTVNTVESYTLYDFCKVGYHELTDVIVSKTMKM